MSEIANTPVIDDPRADVEIESGPVLVNADLNLAEIPSLLERAFEDSRRDAESIVVYTGGAHRDAVAFEGVVVAYDEEFVVLVENPSKHNAQQNLVHRDAIIGVRSKYNMLEHVAVD